MNAYLFRPFRLGLYVSIALAIAGGAFLTSPAQSPSLLWNPSAMAIGSPGAAGSVEYAATTPSWILTTEATGFGAGSPAAENFLFAASPASPSASVEWTAPDPLGTVMSEGSTAGIMMRPSNDTSPGAPFVFAGVTEGTSGVELAWRVAPGQPLLRLPEVIPGTAFPAGSRLKLEVVQGRVFLSYKKASDAVDLPWRRRLAVDLSDTTAMHAGLALCGTASSSATLEVAAADLGVSAEQSGARFSRLVEPYRVASPLEPRDRLSMKDYQFYWEDYTYLTQATKQDGLPAQRFSGGDYWQWELDEAEWVASPELQEVVTLDFDGIKTTSVPGDTMDVYIRLGETGAGMATPVIVFLGRTYPYAVQDSPLEGPLGEGLWIYAGTVPKTESGSHYLTLRLEWLLEDSPGGLKNKFGFDGMLLMGRETHTDENHDGLPDDFGGHFAPWLAYDGDFDGDGYSNGEEYLLGSNPSNADGSSSPDLSVIVPTSDPWHLARNHWSRLPAEIQAHYPGTSPPVPVKGYGIRFESYQGAIGFGAAGNAAPWKGDFITTTDATGTARSSIWLDENCPTPAGSSTAGHQIQALGWRLSTSGGGYGDSVNFKVRPYDNLPPGPIDLIAEERMLSMVRTTGITPHSKVAVAGEWLARGSQLFRWNQAEGTWKAAYQLRPAGLASNVTFGEGVVIDGGTLVAHSSEGKVYTFVMAADRQTWIPWGTSVEISGGLLALKGNYLAIGNPGGAGSVRIYERGATNWVLSTTLYPSSGMHSDAFGTSVAFSEDGQRLVVGAPGDPAWYTNSYNQPYWGYVTRYIEHNDPIYDWVMDGEGNYNWEVVGYYTWTEEYQSWEEITFPPPAQPSVYVFERSSGGTWSQTGRVYSPLFWSGYSIYGFPLFATEQFGNSVAALGDWVLVGAPYYNEGAHAWTDGTNNPMGGVYGFKHDGTQWSQVDVERRGNTRFGQSLVVAGGRAYVHAPQISLPVDYSSVPGYLSILTVGESSLTPVGEISLPSAPYNPVLAADADALLIGSSSSALDEYQWLPVVDWDAPEETTKVGWLLATDEDLANANAAIEEVTLSLGSSTRWDLDLSLSQTGAPAHEDYQTEAKALSIKEGAALDTFAPGVDWLEARVTDTAGDAYIEFFGIRVRGAIPTAPVLVSLEPVAEHFIRLEWEPSEHQPTTYIVERAYGDSYQSALDNEWEPEAIDTLFTEAARVNAPGTEVYQALATSSGSPPTAWSSYAYRVRAQNEEGFSAASAPLLTPEIDADHDGLPDWWEALFGGDLDRYANGDGDSQNNYAEYLAGTNPLLGDTDGDGALDGTDSDPLNDEITGVSFNLYTALE